MRLLLGLALVLTFSWASASIARAEKVEQLRSYWNADHTAILSDLRVTKDDGSVETRSVFGGSVDGIGMIQFALYGNGNNIVQFVPTRDKAGARIHWGTECVFITPDAAGTSQISGDGEFDAIQSAIDEWNNATASCSYLKLMMLAPVTHEVGLDGVNVVKFREDRWCRPASGSSAEKCYDAGATAITTLFFVDKAGRSDDGTILDTDIEINSVDYAMATGCEVRCVTNATHGVVEDLQNTLTHEIGHILGLDHTCWASDGTPPVDDQGHTVPNCRPQSSLPADIINATMFTFQEPMETKKRTPEPDDVEGVCTNYPIAEDPGAKLCVATVVDTSSGCCSVAGAPARQRRDPAVWAWLAALAAATFTARACSRNRRR